MFIASDYWPFEWDLEDLVGDAWEFLLVYFLLGYIVMSVQRRRMRRRHEENQRQREESKDDTDDSA